MFTWQQKAHTRRPETSGSNQAKANIRCPNHSVAPCWHSSMISNPIFSPSRSASVAMSNQSLLRASCCNNCCRRERCRLASADPACTACMTCRYWAANEHTKQNTKREAGRTLIFPPFPSESLTTCTNGASNRALGAHECLVQRREVHMIPGWG